MSELLEELIQIQKDSMTLINKIETHCMDLCLEITKMKSKHFNKIDTHYESGVLLCTYFCNLDGKTYNVIITPQKE
jgi:hypothetical protein